MNKFLYILGLAGVALFSACSTSDDLSIGDSSAVDKAKESVLIYEAGQNSEVPITLGVGQSRGLTRAPLNSTDVDVEGYGNFTTEDGRYIGVFCLATGTQNGVSNIPTAVATNHWSADANGELGGLLVKLKDVPAKVTQSGSTYSFKFWRITGDKEEHYYYPMSNWMKYNFYAYYPQSNSSTIVINEDLESQKSKVEVTGYEIDGSQDLIWGMSDQVNLAEVAADPYSANYFSLARQAAGGGDISAYYPEFKFKHQLVQFNFFVKAADDAAYNILNDVVKAKVTDMYIENAIYKLKFCVASQAGSFDDCKLTKDGNIEDVTKQLGIKRRLTNNNVFIEGYNQWVKPANNNVSLQTVSNGYVGYIMLPSPKVYNDSYTYQLKMNVNYKDGSEYKDKKIMIELESPDGFMAGKTYNIIIRLDSSDLGLSE